ncbi:MAG: proteasome alpha subunit [archaeon GW2011_AR4]|nr:MAG: proteasome alpha subunit [archaeon GW2011_AR4]
MAGEESMGGMQHQIMGYDRAITMFSPDGRLLQVEYAKKTVKQGSTAVGMVCKDGVLLVTDKRIMDKLVVSDAVEKIFMIDNHIAASAAGILSDARVLIERAQIMAQQHRITYDTPIDVISVVKDLCSLKQLCTQSAGLRPFGVSTLLAGVDVNGPVLFETDPTGIFWQYRATAIGESDTEIEEFLQKNYRPDLSLDEGLRMAIKAMVNVLDKNFSVERIDAVQITTAEKKFEKINRQAIDKALKEIKKK